MRGLTRAVIALIVPPLPAVSRPSKTMQTFGPGGLHPFLQATSSPCRLAQLVLVFLAAHCGSSPESSLAAGELVRRPAGARPAYPSWPSAVVHAAFRSAFLDLRAITSSTRHSPLPRGRPPLLVVPQRPGEGAGASSGRADTRRATYLPSSHSASRAIGGISAQRNSFMPRSVVSSNRRKASIWVTRIAKHELHERHPVHLLAVEGVGTEDRSASRCGIRMPPR